MSTENNNSSQTSIFEQIKRKSKNDVEFWLATDLAGVLDYKYLDFLKVIEKARLACINSGLEEANHFVEFEETVFGENNSKQVIRNYILSRYACYLIIENADPAKTAVAVGQTYFAVQTERMEQTDRLSERTENQKRLYLRGQLNDFNKKLASTARKAGVIRSEDFAIFKNHGYRGLYGNLTAKDIHARKGLAKSQEILDWMGSEELGQNIFLTTQTGAALERLGVKDKDTANDIHYKMGARIRDFIIDVGGTLPENAPTPRKSILQIKKEEEQNKQGHQLSMFDDTAFEDSSNEDKQNS